MTFTDGPKGEGHAYMDIGGRAMQEQLPRKYFVTRFPTGVRLAQINSGIAVKLKIRRFRRNGRAAEGAPLLRVYRVYSSIEGSNPSFSAIFL